MNEVKGQEVRTSSMVPGADARYLTYGRLNGRFEYNKNIYHGKWERYSDGTSRLVKYVEPRVKPSALLSSSNSEMMVSLRMMKIMLKDMSKVCSNAFIK